MPGYNLLQLVAVGPEDKFIYDNPKFSYFKYAYIHRSNFASTYNYVSFDSPNGINFDSNIKFTIPRQGDILGGLYLRIKLSNLIRTEPFYSQTEPFGLPGSTGTLVPQFTSYVNGIGGFIIEYADYKIGEQLIERLDGDTIFINNQYKSNSQQKQSFNSLIKYYQENFTIGVTNISNMELILPIPFSFTTDPKFYLPLVALANTEVQIVIKLKPFYKCIISMYNTNLISPPGPIGIDGYQISGGIIQNYGTEFALGEHINEPVTGNIQDFELIAHYYYLGDIEKRLFSTNPLTYLIPILRTDIDNFLFEVKSTNETRQFEINPKFPVINVWWLLQRQDIYNINQYDNFTYENPLQNSGTYYPNPNADIINNGKIVLDNYDIVDRVSSLIYSKLEQYERFITNVEALIYSYCFCLRPNDYDPTGTFNFSRMRYKILELYFNNPNLWQNQPLYVRTYYRYFNLLTIRDGLAGVSFI